MQHLLEALAAQVEEIQASNDACAMQWQGIALQHEGMSRPDHTPHIHTCCMYLCAQN